MVSTVLFFNEMPVGYVIEQVGKRIYFTPSKYSRATGRLPAFYLSHLNNMWKFDSFLEDDIKEQVLVSLHQFQAGKLLKLPFFVKEQHATIF